MILEKQVLTAEEIAAQLALELPDRALMSLIYIGDVEIEFENEIAQENNCYIEQEQEAEDNEDDVEQEQEAECDQ